MGTSIFLQTTLNGLMIGGVYALVAVGLTLIFGVMKIVNFAQGEFVMLGMYVSWMLAHFAGIGPYEGLAISAVIMFVIGYL
ncbi:branched-chain amino acid ABC transporter permease, partial [bacterium]|nr:branched-chain amino acid ABC transporter permease [bacterium]